MADITLVADPARPTGSRSSGRLRAAGRIPAVIYGHGIEPLSVSVDAKALRQALGGEAGSRALLRLLVGDGEHLAMARQLQRHPVRHTVIHVDFQVVRRDEVIGAEVPVLLVGEATAVTKNDGTVDQELTLLAVKAKPADLPPHVEVDISALQIGDSVRAGEIPLPPGVELDVDPEVPVLVAHARRVVVEEAEEAEAGAEEAEAGGEAPAAEADSSDAS